MKAKVDDKGNLTIELEEVFEAMTPDARREAAKILCASPVLMGAVLECVSRGDYFNDDDRGAWWFGQKQVLELREKLLPLMPEVARAAVMTALEQRNEARKTERETNDWAWTMFHAWPEGHQRARPDHPRGYTPPPKPTEAEVDALFGDAPEEDVAQPIGTCSKCGVPVYIKGGFCGGCHPERV